MSTLLSAGLQQCSSCSSSNWILMSCQPHRVTSGQSTVQQMFWSEMESKWEATEIESKTDTVQKLFWSDRDGIKDRHSTMFGRRWNQRQTCLHPVDSMSLHNTDFLYCLRTFFGLDWLCMLVLLYRFGLLSQRTRTGRVSANPWKRFSFFNQLS